MFYFPSSKKKKKTERKKKTITMTGVGASVCLNLASATDFVVVFARESLVYHHDQGPAQNVIVNIV